MELMERVREIGADAATLRDEQLGASRNVLTREIDRAVTVAQRSGRARRRIGLATGGGVLIAGFGAAAVFVVASVIAPPQQALPSAAAAEVFEKAAVAVEADDDSLQAGQFLRIEQTRRYLVTDGGSGLRSDGEAGFTYREVDVTYVPADRADDWIIERQPMERLESFGDGADEAFERWHAGYDYRSPGLQVLPGGVDLSGHPIEMYRDLYDEMPREPGALLAWFEQRAGVGNAKAILDALALDLPPADLRAAMYRALSMIPGITVAMEDGSQVTLEQEFDVDQYRSVSRFVVDLATGRLVRFSTTTTSPGADAVAPLTVPDVEVWFDTSVVDTAPIPGR